LGESDEGLLLYETVSLLRGEVYFRDVFDFIPPGTHAVYALVFAFFGASIDTARIATALLHGAVAAAVFAACRRLGVRGALAAAAGLAPLAIAQPAWPYASAHWLSTALLCAFLVVALRRGGSGRAALLGVLAGLLSTIHPQKGPLMLACAAALLAAERTLARPVGAAPTSLARQLLALAAGGAVIAVPFFAALALWAGPAATWAALIEFPLVQYAGYHAVVWGQVTPLSAHLAAYTWPRLLAALPLALLPVAARAGLLLVRRRDAEEARRLLALVLVGGAAVVSVLYNADFIHLAFIAPLMLVAAAVDLDWLLGCIAVRHRRGVAPAEPGPPRHPVGAGPPSGMPRGAGAEARWRGASRALVATALLAAIALQMGRNLIRARA
jgi:hypothetical protein